MSDNNATPQVPFGNDPQPGSNPSSDPQFDSSSSGYGQPDYGQSSLGHDAGYGQPAYAQGAQSPAGPSAPETNQSANPFQPQQSYGDAPQSYGEQSYGQQYGQPAGVPYAQQPAYGEAQQSQSYGAQYAQQPSDPGTAGAGEATGAGYASSQPVPGGAQYGQQYGQPAGSPYTQEGYGYGQPQPGAGQPGQPYPPQGASYYYNIPYVTSVNERWNTLCIVGFVLSFLFPLVGLVLSIIALMQINKNGGKSRNMAVAGIVIGAVFTLIGILFAVFLAWAWNTTLKSYDYSYTDYGADSAASCDVTINGECMSFGDLGQWGIDPDDLGGSDGSDGLDDLDDGLGDDLDGLDGSQDQLDGIDGADDQNEVTIDAGGNVVRPVGDTPMKGVFGGYEVEFVA
ncbi:DUF4190 domain-containing protein [Bifidobacterium aerophilum]|uniref:DUF4190 domain-containing protein n=1 Tax=Bifidobacterium aerophilum TaxID=1798155 RepID=UPI0019542711|nr:DUF4190 domain-containing protein [Bifidobacterium aerophilum]